jgi:RecB family endonuclease NucS
MSEQQVQKKIIDYLIKQGYSVFKTVACNRRGISDIIACSPQGRFTAIEVKAKGKLSTVSPLQQKYIDEVNAHNGIAFAADSLDKVMEMV